MMDYPTSISSVSKSTTSTYDAKTGVITANDANGNTVTSLYCDGGAKQLVVAASAVVALTVTVY